MLSLDGIKGDYRILEIIKDKDEATITTIFNNSFNMFKKDDLLTVIDSSKGYIPLGISVNVKEGMDFKSMGLKSAAKVDLSPNMIIIEDNLKIRLKDCCWQKHAINRKSIDHLLLDKNLKTVKKVLKEEEINYGAIPLLGYIDQIISNRSSENLNQNPVIDKFIDILKCFFRGLKEGKEKIVIGSLKKMIGLGYGTTPSGDDILLGIIVSSNYLDNSWTSIDLVSHIKNSVQGKTTLISEKYLIQATKGNISERLHSYMEVLLFGKSEKELKKVTLDLVSVGASSGAEIILGTIMALNFYLKTNIDQSKTT